MARMQNSFYGIVLAAQFMLLGMIGVCYALLSAWYAFETGLEAVGVGILYIFNGCIMEY